MSTFDPDYEELVAHYLTPAERERRNRLHSAHALRRAEQYRPRPNDWRMAAETSDELRSLVRASYATWRGRSRPMTTITPSAAYL